MAEPFALLLVDHGSKRAEANALLEEVATLLCAHWPGQRVAVAHMELAAPSIGEAVDTLVAEGFRRIVIHPYFLGPGRHATQYIPQLALDAAARHTGLCVEITEPLGLHPALVDIIQDRVAQAKLLRAD